MSFRYFSAFAGGFTARDPPVHVKSSAASTATVAAVTFANGGDNIGIYTPLFATSDATHLTFTLLIFYVLLAIWCFLGSIVGRHAMIAAVLSRFGHIIVPFVLAGLGIYIIINSGTLSLLRL